MPGPVLLGVVASVSGLVSVLPQILRARRVGTAGLSWSAHVIGLSVTALWAVYGLSIVDWVQIVTNGSFLVLNGLLAVAIVRSAPPGSAAAGAAGKLTAVATVAGTAAAAWATSVWLSPLAVAAAATVAGSARMVPQVRVALSGVPLWGLDPWALLLAWWSGFAWVSYGVAVGDPAVVVSSGLFVVLQGVVVSRRLPLRRTVRSLADGRLGERVAWVATPASRVLGEPSPA